MNTQIADGVDLVEREDGYYLLARFECEEAGPFDTEAEAREYLTVFRPCLAPAPVRA